MLDMVKSCRSKFAEYNRRGGIIPLALAVTLSVLKCKDADIELVEQVLLEFCSDGVL